MYKKTEWFGAFLFAVGWIVFANGLGAKQEKELMVVAAIIVITGFLVWFIVKMLDIRRTHVNHPPYLYE